MEDIKEELEKIKEIESKKFKIHKKGNNLSSDELLYLLNHFTIKDLELATIEIYLLYYYISNTTVREFINRDEKSCDETEHLKNELFYMSSKYSDINIDVTLFTFFREMTIEKINDLYKNFLHRILNMITLKDKPIE